MQITNFIFQMLMRIFRIQFKRQQQKRFFIKWRLTNHSLLLQKLFSILIDSQSGKPRLKRQWPFHLETDGEENACLKILKVKSLLKISQYKVRQAVEKRKSLDVQQNLLKLLSFVFKQPNIHKLATSEKMQAQSFKISTSSKLNLAKIGVNNYKAKYEKFMHHISTRVKQQCYLQILDAMIGDQITDQQIINKKLEDLKKGHYNSQVITLIPGTYKPRILTELNDPYPPQRSLTRQVKQVYHILYQIYHDRMKEMHEKIDIQKQAIKNVEEEGIIFIDEIDKLAIAEGPIQMGKGVSTEGVQRDLLPIIQGTTINTKYGDVKTDHILFIASGSFSMSKVDDLIPQLLGRLPIKVKLNPITETELVRILTEPQFNLLFQNKKLMQAEGINLVFTNEAVRQIARCAYQMNLHSENLGARRLHSIVQKVLQEISFQASQMRKKEGETINIQIDQALVKQRLQGFWEKTNVRNFLI